jgi:hypothetical protein
VFSDAGGRGGGVGVEKIQGGRSFHGEGDAPEGSPLGGLLSSATTMTSTLEGPRGGLRGDDLSKI